MLKVYTKINSKLAMWVVDRSDLFQAYNLVKRELPTNHKSAILILVPKLDPSPVDQDDSFYSLQA